MQVEFPHFTVHGNRWARSLAIVLGGLLLSGPGLRAQTPDANPTAEESQATAQNGAQATSQSTSTASAIADLEPALNNVGATLAKLDISGWKLSREGRATVSSDVESIQQDLGKTLPALIETATASGQKVAPTFAVYRNVDALYDVLLRVSSLANFAAPREEARSIEHARAGLEAGRSALGNALSSTAAAQDSEMVKLRQAVARKPPAAPPTTTVINDGPVRKHGKRAKPSSKNK